MDARHPSPGPGTRPGLSRRRLLQFGATAAAAAAASQFLRPSFAFAADVYDGLRSTWVGLLTGTGFDPTVAPFKTALATMGTEASSFQSSMAPTTGSLWPDLPIGSVSANMTNCYVRLRTMALAYLQPSTGLTGSSSLASAILTGLDWMYNNAYTPTTTTYDNWWDWQIGAPQRMLDAALMMYSQLSSTQIANYCAAIDHFTPTSAVASYSGHSTGANRVDLCRVLMLRGVLAKNSSFLTTGQTALSPVFPYVLSGDGFYADGSYIQHSYIPYAAGYGYVLLDDLSRLLSLTAGTQWAITDPDVQNFYTSVNTAFAPFVYNGLIMDGVAGRGLSRGVQLSDPLQVQQGDNTRGNNVVSAILRLADSGAAGTPQSAAWKAQVKGWLQRQYWVPLLTNPSVDVPELARAQALLNDSTVTPTAEPASSAVFGMDRAVHRRANWAAQLSICSSRTTFYETGNGENLQGWHQNNGMLYWYGDTYGNGQYADNFWPTVDPYKLPGTTVSTLALANAAGGSWGNVHPNTAWAGGATDGTYSVVGQDVRGVLSTLVGKKSWFCLDDSIYCLGAGITCTDGVDVQTTIDNRNLGPSNTHVFTVDGTTQPTTLGWGQTFTGSQYMAIDKMGAWVFPGGATVNAKREARTGAWSNINTNSSTTAVTRNYISMWFDHGTNPIGATYCYQLMPGATATTAAARAANPNVTVLANTATVQAISCPSLGLTMANFFAAGSAGPITVSGPCSVLIREQGGSMTVVVSDPTRAATTVQVTIARTGYASVTSAAGITVLSTSGQISLLAETGGKLGVGQTAVISTSGTAPTTATAAQLAATASTYVRDGSYANTNYGNATTMTVKNANAGNSGSNYESLLKFDVSGLTGKVSRAVLWVYGNVQDSAGIQTALQAFGTASDSWTESSVTWNSAPARTTALGTGMVSTGAGWVGLDVTSAVAAAQTSAGGDGTASLAVFEPLGAAGLSTVLNTRLNTTNPPRLEVVTS